MSINDTSGLQDGTSAETMTEVWGGVNYCSLPILFPALLTMVYLSQCLMLTFQHLWSSCSIQSLVISKGRMVFLLTQISTVWWPCASWMSLQPWQIVFKQFAQQQMEGCRLMICFWVLRCFSIFWTVSDIVFKADVLPTGLFTWKTPQHRSHIRFECWKQSAQQNRNSLVRETKPTVVSIN